MYLPVIIWNNPHIREQDPLKQGLKLFNRTCKTLTELIREQDPLKQGLKLSVQFNFVIIQFSTIREQDPLKQGLKLIMSIYARRKNGIREQDPLKQGLKRIPI